MVSHLLFVVTHTDMNLANVLLVNPDDESELVTLSGSVIGEGSFGRVYDGDFIIKEGEDIEPEYVSRVVAKRNIFHPNPRKNAEEVCHYQNTSHKLI